jgi:hypothetical protein
VSVRRGVFWRHTSVEVRESEVEMDVGRQAVVTFKDEFVEGTIIAVATNDEKQSIYKVDSAAFPKGPMWVPADRVYQILN